MRARLRLVTFAVPVPIFISLRLAGIIIGRIRDVTCSDFCDFIKSREEVSKMRAFPPPADAMPPHLRLGPTPAESLQVTQGAPASA